MVVALTHLVFDDDGREQALLGPGCSKCVCVGGVLRRYHRGDVSTQCSAHKDDRQYNGYNYSDHMDNTSTKTALPSSHNGTDDQETCPPGWTDSNTSPIYETPPYEDDTQENGSNGIYENISETEETLYDEASDYRTAGHERDELINTEISYVQSLRLLTSHIQPRLAKIPEVDVKSLFCNVDEILLLHETFLSELKATEKDEQTQPRQIASLFQEFSRDMENSYALYCYGYARSSSLLQSYQESHVSEKIIEVLQTVPNWDPTKQWQDLSFYLVQPVQRITRYPLLLKNLLKVVQDKQSQEALQRALETMNVVNININENKRRKEIASKYLQTDQRTLIEKMSQLSTHTISKKTHRLSHFIKRETGMSPKKEDKEFDRLAESFHRLTVAIIQLEENVVSYVKSVQAYLSIQPQTYPLEFLHGAMHPVQSFSNELCNRVFPVFKRRIQLLVLQPISNLSELLKGPRNLIKKRTDKLLDYEKLEEKYSETGKMTYEEEDIVNNYKAIHSMLMLELPHCISLSLQWLQKILITFISLQKDLSEQGKCAAEKEASQAQYNVTSEAQFRRWAEETIRQSESQLEEFIKKINDESLPPIEQEHSPNTEYQIQQLMKRYGSGKLYQVVSSFSGSKEMELSLSRGDVVAVLQLADTKGNRNRWLVDTGGKRGYIPSNKLQPYVIEQNPTHFHVSEANQMMERRRSSPSLQVCPYPTSPVYTDAFQIVAGYPFAARSQFEVSIMAGEPVSVLEPHDKEGRPEWSLVEVNGRRGYVPSSYLIRVPVQANSRRPSMGNYNMS
ncbi:rho guanine nucleotide exchange factor 37 [Gastrophryne carolinensis]